ncbi:MAG: DMT family transporter [Rhodospirillales bacterium]
MPPVSRNNVVAGALWMLAQTVSFAGLVAVVRWLSPTFSAYEIVFFRCIIGIALQLPWLMRTGVREMTTRNLRLVLLRGLFGFAGMATWFAALGVMALSDAVALQFTLPLFIIVGAALFLHERVDARRAVATLVGFAGALVIIRPGFVDFSPAALLVLLSAVFYAGTHLTTKRLAGTVSGPMLAFQFHAISLPLALGPAIPAWVWPSAADLPWLLALGAFGTLAHVFMGRAYALADISIIAPIDFLKLVGAAVFGWFLFREASDVWTWVGAAIIFASTTYITRLEARRERARAAARV